VLISQSPTLIEISYNAPDDGGSPLLDFVIYSDGAINSYQALAPTAGSGSTLTYSITDTDHGITPGLIYDFKVAAVNAVNVGY